MALIQEKQLLDTINVSNESLTEVISLVEELITNKIGIESIRNDILNLGKSKILEQELRIVEELQSSVKKIGLQKLQKLESPLHERHHQLCTKYELEVDFQLEGLELEIDSLVISELDILLAEIMEDLFECELLNSKKVNKTIQISVEKDDSFTLVQVECNCNSTGEAMLEMTELGQAEMIRFLQRVGYTKSRTSIVNLQDAFAYTNGRIHFEAVNEEFTRILIAFPISSSILQGMLITSGEQSYVIPTSLIETIINANSVSRESSMNKQMISYRDEVIPLLDFAEIIKTNTLEQALSIVIVVVRNQRYGILVDSIIDQADLVVKPKPAIMKEIKEFSGTTITGDGEVILVLDVPAIVRGV